MLRRCIRATALLAVALLAGCSARPPEIVETEGFVLLEGVPLPKAKVRFFPQFDNASEYIAQGVTDEHGHFTLTCHGQPGACATENIVTVTEDDIPERLTPESARAELQVYLKGLKNRPIPATYANTSETPITVTVTAGQKHMIHLKR
jgi:hypothetical protein